MGFALRQITLDRLPGSARIPIVQATLTIDDDLMEQARRVAQERAITLDSLVAESLRKSLPRPVLTRPDNGLPFFPQLPGEPMITEGDLRKIEEEDF